MSDSLEKLSDRVDNLEACVREIVPEMKRLIKRLEKLEGDRSIETSLIDLASPSLPELARRVEELEELVKKLVIP